MIDKKFADLFAQGSQVSIEIAEREIVLERILKILQGRDICGQHL